MPNYHVDEKPGQDNPRQLHRSSRRLPQGMQAHVKSRSDIYFPLVILACIVIILISGSVALFMMVNQQPSFNKPISYDVSTTQIVVVFSTLLLGIVLGFACYRIVCVVIKYRRDHRFTTNFRTTYHLSPLLRSSNNTPTVHIRVVEEPLTAQNFSLIMSALTELHTKCWLIAKGRFTDLIEYSQTRNARFPTEACFTISKLAQNSPAEVKFNVNADASAQSIAEAIKLSIDAISQAPLRRKELELANQEKELEMKLRELQTQSELDDNRQTRQIHAQRAELELEKQRLEIDRQTVALQKERLEYQIAARDFAFETATMMIEKLYPEVDKSSKAMLIRTLIPELLQLGNGKGLELALPAQQVKEDEAIEGK